MHHLRILLSLLLLTSSVLLTSCSAESSKQARGRTDFPDVYAADDTWTIYWYLCGSDLESEHGAATADLEELLETQLPENVRVLIETGGARTWQSDIAEDHISRYLYDKDGLHLIETLPDASMGDGATLADFLRFGRAQYAADHSVFIFWDHGGGSAAGVCFDERTGDALSLNEIRAAFADTYGLDESAPPFELIGFDACLMATYATMATLHGSARYVVGSEEVEPGNGWNWQGWVQALADRPAMGGAELGKCIADAYYEGCETYGTEDEVTLSVLDEAKLPALRDAYNAFAREALGAAQQSPQRFTAQLSRSAGSAENYGGNTRDQGYTNMVDLAGLAAGAAPLLPSSGALTRAIDDAVVYQVTGPYRAEGRGISSYYSYSGDADDFLAYAEQSCAAEGSKYLYYYLLFGEFADGTDDFLKGGTQAPAALSTPAGAGTARIASVAALEDTPVEVDDDGTAYVTLSEDAMELLDSVHCQLFYFDEEEDLLLCLGSDANIDADWDTGVFKDRFDGTWPMLDGHPVYIELTAEEDGYNLYAIPIKLNGRRMSLIVSYRFDDEAYHILGARRGIDATSGMAAKELRKLTPGDRITTLHYAASLEHPEELAEVEVDTFRVTEKTAVRDEEVGDGSYGYFFEFVPPLGAETTLSAFVRYDIEDGEITTSTE